MNTELEDQLCKNYPVLYRNRHDERIQTLLSWGFACDDGWFGLIDAISLLLSKHDQNIKAIQIKEKLGGLRFYYSPVDAYSRGVVQMAECISGVTCEICGSPGAWYNTRNWIAICCLWLPT